MLCGGLITVTVSVSTGNIADMSLLKNVANQHVTFVMFSQSGVADTGATVSVFTTKDGGAQAAGGGTVTNLGLGQYDYLPTQAETNGTNVSFLFTATSDVIQNVSIFTVP